MTPKSFMLLLIIVVMTSLMPDVAHGAVSRQVHHYHSYRRRHIAVLPLPLGMHHYHGYGYYHHGHYKVKRKPYKRRYMATHCSKTVKLTANAELLFLTKYKTFPAKWKCKVTLEAPPNFLVRVKFLKVRLAVKPKICTHKLNIFDGPLKNLSKAEKLTKKPICGKKVPTTKYVSSKRPLTLEFVSDKKAKRKGRDFAATITPVMKKKCPKHAHGYFQCKNGFCIHSYLRCDGYDNCGDSSDETKCFVSRPARGLTTSQIIIIVVATLGGSMIIGFFVWYFVFRPMSYSRASNYHYMN